MFQKAALSIVLANDSVIAQVLRNTNTWLILLLGICITIGSYLLIKWYVKRTQIQRKVLEHRVEKRTAEISRQKEELQKQSEALQKAYEEIKTKNIAIEEAFEHLTNSFERLSDVNREKDGIVSIVAHDLRTPLNNIEGLIQLVSMDDNLTDDQKDYIAKIRTVVKHGNEMIRDLLIINHGKHQKPELSISTFSMQKFIENWKVSFEEALLSKGQTILMLGDYTSLMLETDQGLLSRIMDNLMSNAIKFSEKGKSITLEVNPQEGMAIIQLRDEGPGISTEDQQKMFKPFTRLTATPTNGEPSNGLGLSIIKSLSKQLGGKIEVESELGKGTCFTVIIPTKAKA